MVIQNKLIISQSENSVKEVSGRIEGTCWTTEEIDSGWLFVVSGGWLVASGGWWVVKTGTNNNDSRDFLVAALSIPPEEVKTSSIVLHAGSKDDDPTQVRLLI